MEITIDIRRTLISLPNASSASEYCVRDFLKIAKETKHPLTIALSGGSTPKGFYHALTTSQEAALLDWTRFTFFWSDERAFPPDHPESNFHMCMEFFKKEPFCRASFFRMPADEKDLEQAAASYEKLVLSSCFEGRFDIVYLGMGDDGHTASLFPDTAALDEQKRLVVANYVPAKKSWRMTFTFACINQARHIVVLVLGASKKEPLKKALQPQSTLPIWRVGTAKTPALFITDYDAYESSGN
jgi:6-phosphogluconolactonase